MKLNQSTSLRQQVSLSPKMLQGLRVLRLSSLELRDLIHEQLLENPALELPEPSGEEQQDVAAGTEAPAAAERAIWDDFSHARPEGPRGGAAGSERQDPIDLAASPETLADYLALQLDLQELTPQQVRIGETIIGSLDEDGYLRETTAKVAELTGSEGAEVAAVLAIVQGFDPPGVAARDLAECLLNQMDEEAARGLPGRIVRECLPLLARGSHCRIAEQLSATSTEVTEAVSLIRRLDPAPGAAFEPRPPAAAVIPDVFIRKAHGELAVLANRQVTPSLSLSKACERLAERPGIDARERKYIREKIEGAAELIREIEQRRLTLTAVARAIADTQPEFFDSGPSRLRPASLDDVASLLDVHASTVSRAIQGKYLSTAFGIFEFKYFFPSGCDTADGRRLAAPAIKQQLGEMIGGEDRRKPLSDERLSRMLSESGINISRRTVAKYREEMGLPASYQRKEQR